MEKIIAICIFSLGIADFGLGQKVINTNKEGIALDGYDPVSYFLQKPSKGHKDFSVNENGVIYEFSSPQNEETFKKNPAKYEPQYGGWCAYAMGLRGAKVEVDPETYKVLDGKLYLFYNKFLNNTLTSWNRDELKLRNKADKNWLKIIK